MTLDKDTLTSAEKARDHLLELHHSAEVARVDYHHTIRKLHAAGGSLREIADALGLSHQRVHQIVEPVDGASPSDRGPGHKIHRRLRGLVPFERFTAEARTAVKGAIEESAALGHRRVGTEHLLISLVADKAAPAGSALVSLGITREAVVTAVTDRLGAGPAGSAGHRPFTPASRRVLARALKEAARSRDGEITSKHVLLGLVADGGDAAAILDELGASADSIVASLNNLAAEGV
jgi:Clp amino terminal domain, pathogenicity island component